MSVTGINIVPPQLEISASVTKQMFNLEKNLVDKLLSSVVTPNLDLTSTTTSTNLEYLDLYKGNLVDIYV